jgi:hypothetical protein
MIKSGLPGTSKSKRIQVFKKRGAIQLNPQEKIKNEYTNIK